MAPSHLLPHKESVNNIIIITIIIFTLHNREKERERERERERGGGRGREGERGRGQRLQNKLRGESMDLNKNSQISLYIQRGVRISKQRTILYLKNP